ncbi:MAG TPA: hypothetical protein VEW48_08715 [Thermoanaerobaculia bacterium]|nr:hypothetical protein [Thermoanaerobaculia bacterium]
MPNKDSFADVILEADQTVAACEANAALLESAGRHLPPLKDAVAELKTLDFQRQTLIADKQKTTQDMKASVRRVKDLLLSLRAAVRGDIGPRSEKLVEFNVTPLRARKRKPKPEPVEPKPVV